MLQITSRGIDIPRPYLCLPPSVLSSGAAPAAAACSLFRGSKKSSRRSKNSSAPALPRLGAACLPQHLNTNKTPSPPPHLHHNHQDDGAAATSSAPPPKPTDTSSEQHERLRNTQLNVIKAKKTSAALNTALMENDNAG